MSTNEGKRYVRASRSFESTPYVDAFLAEVEAVCRKYGLSISHEDGHGAFLIDTFDEYNIRWLNEASDDRKAEERGLEPPVPPT